MTSKCTRSIRRAGWAGSAGLLALLAACSSDSTSAPTASSALISQDVATVAADAAAQDVEVMRGPSSALFGLHLPAAAGKFECGTFERDNFTVVRTCTFKDAAGNVQAAYDAVTTASVTVHVTLKGSIDRGPWSGTIDRTRDFTVTGLAGAETQITWNGTGSEKVTRVKETEDGVAREFDLTGTSTATNVVIPVPRSDHGWPLSGTITTHVTVKFTGGPRDGTTETRDVVITFDGTEKPTVTVNGQPFEFDFDLRHRARHKG